MELRRRSNSPYWFVDLRLEDGTRLRKSTKQRVKKLAEKVAADMQRDIDQNYLSGRQQIGVMAALQMYQTKLQRERRPSAAGVLSIVAKVARILPATLMLSKLSARHLEDIRLWCIDQGNGPATIGHLLTVLRAADRYAHSLNYAASEIRSWGLPRAPHRTRWLTVEEVAAVLRRVAPEGAPERFQGDRRAATAMVHLLVGTGMRWGELTALTWRDVDLARGELHVHAGKLKHTGRVTTRIVPLSSALVDMLREMPRDNDLLFHRGGAMRQRCPMLAEAIDAVCNTPGSVSKHGRATIHSLRHTYASRLRQGDVGLDVVSDMLGHASLQMTRRYAHLGGSDVRDKVRSVLNDIEGK